MRAPGLYRPEGCKQGRENQQFLQLDQAAVPASLNVEMCLAESQQGVGMHSSN